MPIGHFQERVERIQPEVHRKYDGLLSFRVLRIENLAIMVLNDGIVKPAVKVVL